MNQLQTIVLSDDNFEKIAGLAQDRFGLHLTTSKRTLVNSRLQKRLEHHRLNSFDEYVDFLSSPEGKSEDQELISCLTTNVTHFFREPHHFDLIKEEFSKALANRARSGEKIRIWSAGCSTGEETYSLLMSLFEVMPDLCSYDVRVLATDIDTKVLEIAKQGRYKSHDVNVLDETIRSKYFLQEGFDSQIRDELKAPVTFGLLNLIEPFPMSGLFDIVLCRNVTIYFDKQTQWKVWTKIHSQMKNGSLLLIGHSERLSGDEVEKFESVGVTAYRKSIRKSDQ